MSPIETVLYAWVRVVRVPFEYAHRRALDSAVDPELSPLLQDVVYTLDVCVDYFRRRIGRRPV